MQNQDQFGRSFFHVDHLDDDQSYESSLVPPDDAHQAQVVGSKVEGGHMPVLDFDFPCRLVPSSTDGHYHLYIDKAVTDEEYEDLLEGLLLAGLLEEGVFRQYQRFGQTVVRLPWVKKPKDPAMAGQQSVSDVPELEHVRCGRPQAFEVF